MINYMWIIYDYTLILYICLHMIINYYMNITLW